jgi:Domain of Unknown Function (DUF1259)
MKGKPMRQRLLMLLFLSVTALSLFAQQPAATEWKPVDDAMGRAGQDQPDGAHKFAMPRSDLNVTVDGVHLKAGFALGSWAAFRKMGNEAEVMGDLVLVEDEVGPVMQKLISSGIQITALHNHLLHASPQVMYMHIDGRGEAVKLATALHDAIGETKTPAPAPQSVAATADIGFDSKQVDAALGHAGKNNNGVYQVAVPRSEAIKEDGMPIPNSMGLATAINFQPTGDGKAAITGDFVLTGREVNPVIRALRAGGISVTAIHSHMLDEQPRLFFMHFWANDDAIKLAKALRVALDQTNAAKAM